ncbi:MAG: hypothetical protein RL153_1229, partial [Verrucomicrobiota bacterium]
MPSVIAPTDSMGGSGGADFVAEVEHVFGPEGPFAASPNFEY